LKGLASLRQLDLRGNQLTGLPAAVGDMPGLEKLDLRWNPLADGPAWLMDLEQRGCTVWR